MIQVLELVGFILTNYNELFKLLTKKNRFIMIYIYIESKSKEKSYKKVTYLQKFTHARFYFIYTPLQLTYINNMILKHGEHYVKSI